MVIVTCRIIGAIRAPMPSVLSFLLAIIRHILSPLSSLIELRFVYWCNSYNSFCDLPTISCPECSKVKRKNLKRCKDEESLYKLIREIRGISTSFQFKILASTFPAICLVLGFIMIITGNTSKDQTLVTFGWAFVIIGVVFQLMWLFRRRSW